MNFPAPEDCFKIKGRGTLHITRLPQDCDVKELHALIGQIVSLGGQPFKVSGIETYALTHLRAPVNIRLLGAYVEPE